MLTPSGIFGVAAGLVLLAAQASAGTLGGINMVVACHEQYGSTWAVSHCGNSAFDWYCISSGNGVTGGLNLNSYCITTFGNGAYANPNNRGVYDWTCDN